MKRLVLGAAIVFALIVVFCPSARPRSIARDFNAFYCAGQAVADRADPYRAEPLGTCERAPKDRPFYSVPSGLTLPAPLPPYDLAALAGFGRLPFGVAATLWTVLILISLAATIEALHRITELPRSLLLIVLGPIDGWSAVFLGEIAPLAVASLSLAMLAFREDKPRLAALILACSMCEPHVGIAPILAMFVCVPRSRAVLALACLALAAVSLAAVGEATSIEYVRTVLPAHAFSEIESTRQLSLTAFLHSLGFSDSAALSLGSASYIAMLVVGVLTARRLAQRDRNDVLILAAPAAFVLLGGVFIHSIQMPAAFPAALVAYTRVEGRLKTTIGAAIIVLAIPWLSFLAYGIIVPCAAFVAGVLALRLLNVSPRTATVVGLAAACYVYGLGFALMSGAPFPVQAPIPTAPHELAEVSWGANIRFLGVLHRDIFDLARLPTWIAIGTLAVGLSLAARSRAMPRMERVTIGWRIHTPSER